MEREKYLAWRCGFVSRFKDGFGKIVHKQNRTDDNEQH
jgi:hypothetical protein